MAIPPSTLPAMPAILQKSRYLAIPDFRNLGVILRVILLVNLMLLAVALLLPGTDSLMLRVLLLSAWAEPALMVTLAILALLAPWLGRQQQPALPVLAITLVVVSLLDILLFPLEPFSAEHPLLAAMLALLLMHYFSLRQRALSPALSEARLAALQSRIRPHFLFNSLNAAIALIRSKPEKAEMVLENLADLFRAQMADPGKTSTLEREIELARMYLAIESERLGERLNVCWDIQVPLDAALPPLVLQPLVENAVHHGVERCTTPGQIVISAQMNGRQLALTVSNPLSAEPAEPHRGNRMALENLRERLELFFDAEASLQVEISEQQYLTHISLPYRAHSTSHALDYFR